MSDVMAHPEPTGRTDELVEFLSLRMFPEKLTMAAQSEIVSGARKDEALTYLQNALEYETELRELNPDALLALIEDERDRDKQAELEEAAKLETERFFNKPTARAYYRSWVERNHWTLDEATALILGKDPKVVNWDSIDPLVHKSAFARRYESLRRQFLRARFDGMLFEPLVPADFLRYAKSIGFALPIQLDTLLQSNDEDRVRSQQRALDEIQLAKLRRAIEEAAAPRDPEPEPEPEPEPIAEEQPDRAASSQDVDAALETYETDGPDDEAEAGIVAKAAADEDVEAVAEPASEQTEEQAEEPVGDLEAELAAELAADMAADQTEDPAEKTKPDMPVAPEIAFTPMTSVGTAMKPAGPSSIADIAEELIRHTKTLAAGNGALNRTGMDVSADLPEVIALAAEPADDDLDEAAEADAEVETMPAGERETLLKIFAAMAIGRYGYEPDSKRNSTVTDIVRDHEKIGLNINASTVRKWLREASKLVPVQDD